MRLIWTTDLHLDHTAERDRLRWIESIASQGADGVVITGDISEGDDVIAQLQYLANSISMPIFFVLGNHDFYHGSIGTTRQRVVHAARESDNLHYLTDTGAIALGDDALVTLVGEDGWGDASEGNYEDTPIELKDFRLIEDFHQTDSSTWKQQLNRLGAEAAARLQAKLESISPATRQVIIATHVPPFCEACWYEGKTTDENWAPFFVCGQLGKMLLSHADHHPDQQFTVLCGHTHHDGTAKMSDNLIVRTGAADFGHPKIEGTIMASSDGVALERHE
ncbi:MAG: metallophosphoesterase [Rubripirellula sp.]|nr:metallophosphoesterase [Rubripirellula sp.]